MEIAFLSESEGLATRTVLAFAICKEYAIETDNEYTAYDAWEAIEDELHVTVDKVRHVLYRALISKKTGRSMSAAVPVTLNLAAISNWLNNFSIEALEAFRSDVKADLVQEREIRVKEKTAREELIALYTRVINGDIVEDDEHVDFFVSKRQKRFIKKATNLDVQASLNHVEKQNLEHIMIRHGKGKEGKSRNDTTMLTGDSVGDIVDVLLHCDTAELTYNSDGSVKTYWAYPDRDGKPSLPVTFSKRLNSGMICVVVEAMSDTRKGLLRVVTSFNHH
ncbi:MAG: hypothetical protein LUD51_05145 [Clostridia bacterium]|nr:hypothetical protein [Clostridia bacterium]